MNSIIKLNDYTTKKKINTTLAFERTLLLVSVGLAWDSPAWGCGLALNINLTFNICWV